MVYLSGWLDCYAPRMLSMGELVWVDCEMFGAVVPPLGPMGWCEYVVVS